MSWKEIIMSDDTSLIVPENPDDFSVEVNHRTIHLGIIVELLDYSELFCEWENEKYHICPQISVIVIDPIDKEFLRDAFGATNFKPSEDVYFQAYTAYLYAGGVPLPVPLISEIMHEHGIDEPYWENGGCFSSLDDANTFIDLLIEIAPEIAKKIHYILDRRINVIGNTGWDVILLISQNIDYFRTTIGSLIKLAKQLQRQLND